MRVVAGTDPRYWHDRAGLFPAGTPFASDAGIEVMTGPCDQAAVKRALVEAGYRGERIVMLGTAGSGYIPLLTQIGADTLRRVGMDVDLQLSYYATLARRILKRDPPDKGGWQVYCTPAEGAFTHTPVTNDYIRGDGKSGAPGWPVSEQFEALRQAWLDAPDITEQRRIAVAAQRQLWIDVPYIPIGQWLRVTAWRRDLVDTPVGFAAFYGVRRQG
jgi:peptide/nickel transport system substrate-binding protein